ncbi:MAG: hypothetical protein ACRD6B_25420 [Bryobacteraceae bacterium]
MRLHEKGGKEHEVPCHHRLERFLDEYLAAAGIAADESGPLFRNSPGRSGKLSAKPMHQQDAFRMIRRRAAHAGIPTKIGNHTFRATGKAAAPAASEGGREGHKSPSHRSKTQREPAAAIAQSPALRAAQFDAGPA